MHLSRRSLDLSALVRRLTHFWIVWSGLICVHELGHALAATWQGRAVQRVTVGLGPVLWSGRSGETEMVLRLVPVAGITRIAGAGASRRPDTSWSAWGRDLIALAAGVLATLGFGALIAAVVRARERHTQRRWRWGRYAVADAVVLTVFNFLPVPPLDGGVALLGAITAWRGAPLSGETLFWVQAAGLALAIIPMTLWTRWTSRIDRAAWNVGAPAVVAQTS